MNIKKLKELVELMNDNNLTEIEVDEEGMKVKLVKGLHGTIEQVVMPAARQAPSLAAEAPPQAQPERKNLKEVKAPMVGTFYRSPSPDAKAYVEVGDVVQTGDVLCIVEAMKLMNEVKAEFGGKIVEIMVENADPVEYGQVIFLVEPV